MYIGNRYGKANNKCMKNYDEKAPSKYITFLDANNLHGGLWVSDANSLYGWAMSQYLLTGGFRRLTEKILNKIDLAKYTEDSKDVLILEVDLEYPHSLHDLHNDYQLAAEKSSVSKYVLLNYCKTIRQKYNITI